jgi:catechol 2,3-dioxygenase-like lactoylglutathione lyase family enzyme
MIKRIDHIGVVVDDLESGKGFLQALGMKLMYDLGVPERAVRVSFWKCGDVAIELIQMDDPQANRERLRGEPRAFIEHIAIEVEDLNNTVSEMQARGIEMDGPAVTSKTRGAMSVFTRPETSDGYQLQITQFFDE